MGQFSGSTCEALGVFYIISNASIPSVIQEKLMLWVWVEGRKKEMHGGQEPDCGESGVSIKAML